jgi:hypothetical protein
MGPLAVKPASPKPLMDTCNPVMVLFDGFTLEYLILIFTTVVAALEEKLEHVPAFVPLGTLVLIGLLVESGPAGVGVPPVHPVKVVLTVVTVFLTPGVPAWLRGGLKLMLPPMWHVGEPVPKASPATAVPSNNATLASGNAAAATTINVFRKRIRLSPVCPWRDGRTIQARPASRTTPVEQKSITLTGRAPSSDLTIEGTT